MQFKTILSGVAATFVLCGAASGAGSNEPAAAPHGGGLPGVFAIQGDAPVLMAQADSQGMEEQVRQLNGRIEEMNFQILQLQEQLRKMQEDNEFRFQQLEGGKKSDAGGSTQNRQARVETQPADPLQSGSTAQPRRPMAGDAGQADASAQPGLGQPPQDFGTITFDQSGNVVGGSVGDRATVSRDPNAALPHDDPDAADNTVVAALPQTNDPNELYRSSYESILSGEYRAAEGGFRQHVERFPEDARAADAQFWLGESLLGQQKYRDAAGVFLAARKKFPQAKKAPDMLFKLGVSMAGINQREVACGAFAEVLTRYPQASDKLKQRVKKEQAETRC